MEIENPKSLRLLVRTSWACLRRGRRKDNVLSAVNVVIPLVRLRERMLTFLGNPILVSPTERD